MSATEKVTVTAEHIRIGDQREPDSCPIAHAIKALHPKARKAEVYTDFALLEEGGMDAPLRSARLPYVAQQFVAVFDEDGSPDPFEFELTWETDQEALDRLNAEAGK